MNPASTITAVLSDTPDPSAPGQTVTVSYLVAAAAPGVGTPSGNVVVTDADSAATCTATVAAGQCTLTLNAPGAHHLTATYLGNADFNGSASVAADHQVGRRRRPRPSRPMRPTRRSSASPCPSPTP